VRIIENTLLNLGQTSALSQNVTNCEKPEKNNVYKNEKDERYWHAFKIKVPLYREAGSKSLMKTIQRRSVKMTQWKGVIKEGNARF